MILDQINQPNDIKKIAPKDYDMLAAEIRDFLLQKISVTGGHLASNLGAVELTMALHLAFDLPEDKLIWDVGHQSYTHKLLTGRKKDFDEIRCFGGISGFPNRNESRFDAFNTGHSSTSISAGLGLAQARDLLGQDHYVVSIIGDGSLTGGMAYEALNNASQMKKNFIIVLNDNNMSISENIGGVSRMMNSLRTAPGYNGLKENVSTALSRIPSVGEGLVRRISNTKSSLKQLFIPGMFFENMGLTYLGPVDGHDINQMIHAFHDAKRLNRTVVVHVMTHKGQGYAPAENNPEAFHGVGSFVLETGKAAKKTSRTYTDVFSQVFCAMAKKDSRLVGITAAMPEGTGLKLFHHLYPDRFFDVGIAEEHAVTFAAGLAAGGLKPYVCVYSSFLQRAYDQMIHDVCLQNLNVTFCIDRAGLVGSDGETHQGLFDLSYLQTIPNMNIFAPKNCYELADILRFSAEFQGPLAIRYPRGTAYEGLKEFREPIQYGKSEVLYEEQEIAILAVGSMVETACAVRDVLKAEGYNVTLVNVRFIRPMDQALLERLALTHRIFITMEENVHSGGFGEHVDAFCAEQELPVQMINIAIPNMYVEHGSVDKLKHVISIDAEGALRQIHNALAGRSEE